MKSNLTWLIVNNNSTISDYINQNQIEIVSANNSFSELIIKDVNEFKGAMLKCKTLDDNFEESLPFKISDKISKFSIYFLLIIDSILLNFYFKLKQQLSLVKCI